MLWCSDPLVETLKSYGFNAVRLPQEGLKPLQLLVKNGRNYQSIGNLSSVLNPGPGFPLPPIGDDQQSATIRNIRTGKLGAGIGLSILGDIISALGGSSAGLSASYASAKTITIEFQDVLENRVEIALLDQFLGDADISPGSVHVASLLNADEIYVTTATLKSATFKIDAQQADGNGLQLDIPAFQAAVAADLRVQLDQTGASTVIYQGQKPLIFGFQAIQLFYEDGHYTAFKPLTPRSVAQARTMEAIDPDLRPLVTDAPLVTIA